MLLPVSRLYGYAMIGCFSYSCRDTSHCPLSPVCALEPVICLSKHLLELILMTWHFSGWNFICHIFSHFSSTSRSSCSLFASASDLTSIKRQSLAKRPESEWLIASDRSLMKAKERKGSISVFCGTPEITSA